MSSVASTINSAPSLLIDKTVPGNNSSGNTDWSAAVKDFHLACDQLEQEQSKFLRLARSHSQSKKSLPQLDFIFDKADNILDELAVTDTMNTLSVDQTWQHLKQLYEMEQALSKLDQCTSKMTVEERSVVEYSSRHELEQYAKSFAALEILIRENQRLVLSE